MKDKRAAFEKAAMPLMQYLQDNHHPHMTVIVDSQTAEMVEGKMSTNRVVCGIDPAKDESETVVGYMAREMSLEEAKEMFPQSIADKTLSDRAKAAAKSASEKVPLSKFREPEFLNMANPHTKIKRS